jgi:hypothetical protein
VLDDKGEIRSVYDKLHLFEINLASKDGGRPTNLNESDYTVPGGQIPVPIQAPIGVLANGIVIIFSEEILVQNQFKFNCLNLTVLRLEVSTDELSAAEIRGRDSPISERVHCAHGQSALGGTAEIASHRESMLRDRFGSSGPA